MAVAKRVRWECPNGLHPGVLGSSRPRKNATVRYCLACSEAAGLLVERLAPSLDRKRSAKAAATQARARARRDREREAWANRLKVTVVDADGKRFVLDAGVLLSEAWRTRVLRDEQVAAFSPVVPWPIPELVIRRGVARSNNNGRTAGSGALPDRCLPIRARDSLSGHASGGDRIVMTCGPNLGAEWLRVVVVHEASHVACPAGTHHGPRWRRAYVKALRELYPLAPIPSMVDLDGLTTWQLDEYMAQAIYDMPRAATMDSATVGR